MQGEAARLSGWNKAKSMDTEEVANMVEHYGIAKHFYDFYGVLHTQGGQWLTEEINKMINGRRQ